MEMAYRGVWSEESSERLSLEEMGKCFDMMCGDYCLCSLPVNSSRRVNQKRSQDLAVTSLLMSSVLSIHAAGTTCGTEERAHMESSTFSQE